MHTFFKHFKTYIKVGKANNILGITGAVGKIIFKANGTVAQKPTKKGAENMSLRTKENMSEFGKSAKASKIVRNALQGVKKNFQKSAVGKVTKVMREYLELDTINPRGQRKILNANVNDLAERLKAAYLYKREIIDLYLSGNKPTLTIDNAGNLVTNLFINQNIYVPTGANYFTLNVELARFDFENNTYTKETGGFGYTNMPITSAMINALLTPNLATIPAGTQVLASIIIEFYQKVNNSYSRLKGTWSLVNSRKF